jgi:hypothetical protein
MNRLRTQVCIPQIMILAMFVLLAVGVGHGQSRAKVTIPFNFSVDAQRFSAGEYTVEPLSNFPRLIVLRNERGQALMVWTNRVESKEAPNSAKLVFNQYGGHYFLAQIWEAKNDAGRQLTKSHAEIEMAKEQQSPGQQIALNLAAPH